MSSNNGSACVETNGTASAVEGQDTTQPGRDNKGRFARGNKGGTGNPFNRRVAGLRQLLLERVSDDDLAAIVDKMIDMAKEGDLAAIGPEKQ